MLANLENIYKSATKLLVPLTPDEIYKTIVEEAMKLSETEYGTIFLLQNGRLIQHFTNTKYPADEPRKEGFTYASFKSGKAIILKTKVIKKIHPEIVNRGVKSLIIIPLEFNNKSIGILTLQSSEEKHFNDNFLANLKIFGSLASLAIRNIQLYTKAKNELRLRDLFISMASHELRTPLTTIITFIALLKKRAEKGGKPDPKWIKTLSSETTRLINLFNELFQLDQIKTGDLKYRFKKNRLQEIIRRAMLTFSTMRPERVVIFQNQLFSQKDDVYCDFDKIIQVILNLLNNAAKFSPQQSEIVLSLSSDSGFLILSVTDRGKGINKADLPHIFESFYKGKHHGKEGMGLGLFLTKKIIERHQGIIEVHSKLNKGSVFLIKLPKHNPELRLKQQKNNSLSTDF